MVARFLMARPFPSARLAAMSTMRCTASLFRGVFRYFFVHKRSLILRGYSAAAFARFSAALAFCSQNGRTAAGQNRPPASGRGGFVLSGVRGNQRPGSHLGDHTMAEEAGRQTRKARRRQGLPRTSARLRLIRFKLGLQGAIPSRDLIGALGSVKRRPVLSSAPNTHAR